MPAELSLGQRKLVGVARALAAGRAWCCSTNPRPGSTATESLALGERSARVVDPGIAMLLVDHDMGLVLGVCDEVYVLEFGRVIAAGTPGPDPGRRPG